GRRIAQKKYLKAPAGVSVGMTLNSLADIHFREGDQTQAGALYNRAVAIWQQHPDVDYHNVLKSAGGLAAVYEHLGRYAESDRLYRQVLGINEKYWGSDSAELVPTLNKIAYCLVQQRRYKAAEPFYRRALKILEQNAGTGQPSPEMQYTVKNYSTLLRLLGRNAQAQLVQMKTTPTQSRRLK